MLHRIVFFFLLFSTSLFCTEHVYLTTPDLSQENMIGTNVGIRPFRKSGVRIEAESLRDKLIIHNYGYGGSGLTLCFGGAHEVISILNSQNHPSKRVAVLGGGVIGLATAYDLLEMGYDVRIYSDQWSPQLTSNVGAGIWSPLTPTKDWSEDKKVLHQRLLDISEARFQKSLIDPPEFAGVKIICSYSFITESTGPIIAPKYIGDDDVIVHFDNGVTKGGKRIYEIGLDGKLFMEDLFSKVKIKGAAVETRHFESIDDILRLQEPIIINCTSLGSRELFNDYDLIPKRGQLIYFKKQEGVDYALFQNIINTSNDKYFAFSIYPWYDRIILNGVHEHNKDERTTDQETLNRIYENGLKCLSGD